MKVVCLAFEQCYPILASTKYLRDECAMVKLGHAFIALDNLFDTEYIAMYVHDTRLKFYFEATPGFWSLENLLRRKVTPMAKRMRKSPVVFTICASVLFATYCKLQNVNRNNGQ